MRRRAIRGRSNRRRVQWLGGAAWTEGLDQPIPVIGTSSAALTAWVRVPAAAYDNFNQREVEVDWTVIREINVGTFTAITTAPVLIDVTFGMGVLAWDQITDTPPSILDVPLPVQASGYDWLWWWVRPYKVLNAGTGTQVTFSSLDAPEGFSFTKAQRKLSAGTGLLLVVECFSNAPTNLGTWGFTHCSRYAYKLP